MSDADLILIGASVRAAAFSALRAGFRPWCADLFGDRDLRSRCPVTVVDVARYARGYADILSSAPAVPWLYTGALENRRALIRRLASVRPMWGNDAEALAIVRSPQRVHSILTKAGLPCPAIFPTHTTPPSGRRWLIKPQAGASGVGIRFWDGKPGPTRRSYLQELVEGESRSAAFVATLTPFPSPSGRGERGEGDGVRLLGVTRQLTGESWLGVGAFRYCGSVGPIVVTQTTCYLLERIAQTISNAARLRGLFGIDFVECDGIPWPVEINPRYTASVEVLEHASGLRAIEEHRRAFVVDRGPLAKPQAATGVVGKAILFARRRLTFPSDGPWTTVLQTPVDEMPAFADIPMPGQIIETGRPIMTLFAQAVDVAQCVKRLQCEAEALAELLHGQSA